MGEEEFIDCTKVLDTAMRERAACGLRAACQRPMVAIREKENVFIMNVSNSCFSAMLVFMFIMSVISTFFTYVFIVFYSLH